MAGDDGSKGKGKGSESDGSVASSARSQLPDNADVEAQSQRDGAGTGAADQTEQGLGIEQDASGMAGMTHSSTSTVSTASSRLTMIDVDGYVEYRAHDDVEDEDEGEDFGRVHSGRDSTGNDAYMHEVLSLIETNPTRAMVYSVWDLGGQNLFFPLHHLLLSSGGIYLVLVRQPFHTFPPIYYHISVYMRQFRFTCVFFHTHTVPYYKCW